MITIGKTIIQKSKFGGGSYVIIGYVNCPRKNCNKVIELKEQQEPSKNHRKTGYYWSEWTLCKHCGLYNGENKIYI